MADTPFGVADPRDVTLLRHGRPTRLADGRHGPQDQVGNRLRLRDHEQVGTVDLHDLGTRTLAHEGRSFHPTGPIGSPKLAALTGRCETASTAACSGGRSAAKMLGN